ncbi:hypothetical protein BWK47_08850 [Synechocystis sp. CACIAM 05]|nr:hypothetical protein BWK47_08850 [Synechocystis sp. CACIAM 05]
MKLSVLTVAFGVSALFETTITIDNQDFLITKLRKVAAHYQNFELTDSDQYGESYVAVFPMTTTTGTAKVLSAWIIRPGETYPRLTSVYPIRN